MRSLRVCVVLCCGGILNSKVWRPCLSHVFVTPSIAVCDSVLPLVRYVGGFFCPGTVRDVYSGTLFCSDMVSSEGCAFKDYGYLSEVLTTGAWWAPMASMTTDDELLGMIILAFGAIVLMCLLMKLMPSTILVTNLSSTLNCTGTIKSLICTVKSIDHRTFNLVLFADLRVSVSYVPSRAFIYSVKNVSSIKLGPAPLSMNTINGYNFSWRRPADMVFLKLLH